MIIIIIIIRYSNTLDVCRTLDAHARQNEKAILRRNKLHSLGMAKFDHTAYMTFDQV